MALLLRGCLSRSITQICNQLSKVCVNGGLKNDPSPTIARNYSINQCFRPNFPMQGHTWPIAVLNCQSLLLPQTLNQHQPSRTVTKFSLTKGRRKTVKAVVKRFFRLNNGMWIRPRVARHKRLWRQSPERRYMFRQHVFLNGTQCKMLDKMVTKYWKTPKYYVDDPYEPYHTRHNFPFVYRGKHHW